LRGLKSCIRIKEDLKKSYERIHNLVVLIYDEDSEKFENMYKN